MKKMIFKLRMLLIIIAFIALLSSELFAQEKIDYKQLRDKEWVMQVPDGWKMFVSYTYTVDTCILVAKHLKERVELKSVYYLSDNWNGTFNDTKVGVWSAGAGKYLIKKKKNKDRKVILIDVYEILKLTETDLELRSVESIELTEGGEELSRQKNNGIGKFKSRQE